MGLDISFLGDDPEAAELESERLANVPNFLGTVLLLGAVLEMQENTGDPFLMGTHQAVREYTDRQDWAASRFDAYLAFLSRMADQTGADFGRPLDRDAYSPLARQLAAALMLREGPIDGTEAREMLDSFFSRLVSNVRMMVAVLPLAPGAKVDAASAKAAADVLDRYERCLTLASEKDLAFQISF